jgi:hypothetical protein
LFIVLIYQKKPSDLEGFVNWVIDKTFPASVIEIKLFRIYCKFFHFVVLVGQMYEI